MVTICCKHMRMNGLIEVSLLRNCSGSKTKCPQKKFVLSFELDFVEIHINKYYSILRLSLLDTCLKHAVCITQNSTENCLSNKYCYWNLQSSFKYSADSEFNVRMQFSFGLCKKRPISKPKMPVFAGSESEKIGYFEQIFN